MEITHTRDAITDEVQTSKEFRRTPFFVAHTACVCTVCLTFPDSTTSLALILGGLICSLALSTAGPVLVEDDDMAVFKDAVDPMPHAKSDPSETPMQDQLGQSSDRQSQ